MHRHACCPVYTVHDLFNKIKLEREGGDIAAKPSEKMGCRRAVYVHRFEYNRFQ